MNNISDIQDNEDLAFFGRINASISHELKNIFAIISEAAGLLNDLTELAEKGKPIDLGIFRTCSQDIEEEIQRGFATVKEMNTFSHTADTTVASISLVATLGLMSNIAGYLSYASKVRINVPDNADPMVFTCPFRLQHLIYLALVFAFKMTGPEGEIQVSITADENNDVKISFSNLGKLNDEKFPVDKIIAIADSIHARVCVTDDFQAFDIRLPKAIA